MAVHLHELQLHASICCSCLYRFREGHRSNAVPPSAPGLPPAANPPPATIADAGSLPSTSQVRYDPSCWPESPFNTVDHPQHSGQSNTSTSNAYKSSNDQAARVRHLTCLVSMPVQLFVTAWSVLQYWCIQHNRGASRDIVALDKFAMPLHLNQ